MSRTMIEPEQGIVPTPDAQARDSVLTLHTRPAPAGSAGARPDSPSWLAVLQFHRGSSQRGDALPPPVDSCLPALLHPFRHPENVSDDYPLILLTSGVDNRLCAPLSEVLSTNMADETGRLSDNRVLSDNIKRLELHVRERAAHADPSESAREQVIAAGREMEKTLSLRGEGADQLHAGIEQLAGAIPSESRVLTLSLHTSLTLMLHAAEQHARTRLARLRAQAMKLINGLRDLLRIDDRKRDQGAVPPALTEPASARGSSLLDADALARLVHPTQGSGPMAEDRRRRIERSVETLETFLAAHRDPLLSVVGHDEDRAPEGVNIRWRGVGQDDVCRAATCVFDEQAAAYAAIYAAMRSARLDLVDAYAPSRHDHLLRTFDWRSFTREELLNLPPVIAIESAQHLLASGMLDLSRLLRSGRLVHTMVLTPAGANPSMEDEGALDTRLELSFLGISHREAMINQSSAARPAHLVDGYRQGLESARASLHVIDAGAPDDSNAPGVGAWLYSSAAIEGRAHPAFHYNPKAGDSWAARLDFTGNPQPDAHWPISTLSYRDDQSQSHELEVAFTFADFALLEPEWREHFGVLPAEVACTQVMPIDAWLELDETEKHENVPFIWAAYDAGELHRLVITRVLAAACIDRLNYWRTLQELAGFRNEYVLTAVRQAKDELSTEFDEKQRQLEAAHAEELERVRRETAAEAFQRLAQTLLATDASAVASALVQSVPSASASPPHAPVDAGPEASAAPQTEEPQADVQSVDDEELGFDEAWIDTAICTSCNDCMGINAQIFLYNSNKQAIIGDVNAGPFADIVKAAEICPARCIHPGKPRDPDEPNLEELTERAKPFN